MEDGFSLSDATVGIFGLGLMGGSLAALRILAALGNQDLLPSSYDACSHLNVRLKHISLGTGFGI